MKVGIVGAGKVGSAAANALAMLGVANEIILIDENDALAHAQAEDISLAISIVGDCSVRSGSFDDLGGAGACVVTAGATQQPGETRFELVQRNAEIYRTMIPEITRSAPNAIIVVATDPVDLMTHVACQLAQQPSERVIGCGTIVSTARFQALVGRHFSVPYKSVHAYVLGEIGDSQVLCWTGVEIGGVPLSDYSDQTGISLSRQSIHRIDEDVRRSSYRIIDGKGAAYFGMAGGVYRIVQAIAANEEATLTVSMLTENMMGLGPVTLSLPRSVGKAGVTSTTEPILSEVERRALRRSAGITLEALPPEWRR